MQLSFAAPECHDSWGSQYRACLASAYQGIRTMASDFHMTTASSQEKPPTKARTTNWHAKAFSFNSACRFHSAWCRNRRRDAKYTDVVARQPRPSWLGSPQFHDKFWSSPLSCQSCERGAAFRTSWSKGFPMGPLYPNLDPNTYQLYTIYKI